MKRFHPKQLWQYDSVTATLITLGMLGLVVFALGFVLNPGVGWPLTRNGLNLSIALVPVLLLYILFHQILLLKLSKHQHIARVAALALSVVVSFAIIVALFYWIVSGLI